VDVSMEELKAAVEALAEDGSLSYSESTKMVIFRG